MSSFVRRQIENITNILNQEQEQSITFEDDQTTSIKDETETGLVDGVESGANQGNCLFRFNNDEVTEEVDGPDNKTRLENISRKAKAASGYLRFETTAYSLKMFNKKGKRPYDTPLVFSVFEYPPDSDVDYKTDNRFLLAVHRIISNAKRIMAPKSSSSADIKDDVVKDTIAKLNSINKMLKDIIDRLVLAKLPWFPDGNVTFSDLETQADTVDKMLWPVLKGAGTMQETREKMIKLTFVKQMDHLMNKLGVSAILLSTKV